MTETVDQVIPPSNRPSAMGLRQRRKQQRYFLLWTGLAGLLGASLSAAVLLLGPLFFSSWPGANPTVRSASAPPPAPANGPVQAVALAAPTPVPLPAQGGAAMPAGGALPELAASSGPVTAPLAQVSVGAAQPVAPALAAVAAPQPAAATGLGAQGSPGVPAEPSSRLVAATAPVAAAPPVGSPHAAAGGAPLAGALSAPLERPLSDRQLLESMQVSLEALNAKLLEVAQNEKKNTDAVARLRADLRRVSQPVTPTKGKLPDEAFLLSIFEISASGVVVSDNGKRVTVLPGGKLPGGLIFIGFDPATRKMKTDQGEFNIPG